MTVTNGSSNTSRIVQNVFDKYQKERLAFVQTVADLASRDTNIPALQQAGVMSLLRPLLLDNVPGIQQSAAVALGRLANFNEELASAVVDGSILPQLVYSLSEQNRFYKKSAAFVLRAVSKHNPTLAKAVVDSGAVEALVTCLEEFDPSVKESAAWALGYIARHNGELSQAIISAGAIPLLVLCIQEPELSLKRISASALSDVARHSSEHAQTVVDAGAIAHLTPLLNHPDAKLKRQVTSVLSQISKHTVDLAESVVEGEIFPAILTCLKDNDIYVRKNSATLICELAKHSSELAQLIVNSGSIAAVVDYVQESAGNARLPGIMTLGYVAAFSETLALSVIVAKGVTPLVSILNEENEPHVKAASAWSLGQIGRHTSDHARAVVESGSLMALLKTFTNVVGEDEMSVDLRNKTKRALKSILEKTVVLAALEPLLLQETPPNILKYVVGQYAKVLPHDVKARRAFVTSGGLKRIQEIKSEPGSKLAESIRRINEVYPEEIVRYYSPGYSATLLEKLDEASAGNNGPNSKNRNPAENASDRDPLAGNTGYANDLVVPTSIPV